MIWYDKLQKIENYSILNRVLHYDKKNEEIFATIKAVIAEHFLDEGRSCTSILELHVGNKILHI